jgi:HSP20 family protein
MYTMLPLSPLPFVDLRRRVERLFDQFTDGLGGAAASLRPYPALNIWENEERIFAEAEVPGMQLADVEITVVGNELTIRGRRAAGSNENTLFHRHERSTGEFSRTITLPAEIDADAVEATLRDGVLTVTLPKAKSARARKIPVRGA